MRPEREINKGIKEGLTPAKRLGAALVELLIRQLYKRLAEGAGPFAGSSQTLKNTLAKLLKR